MKRLAKIVVILLVIVYIGKVGVTTFANKNKTTVVTYGSISIAFNAQGYVIKNEMLINAPFDGKIKKLVQSGEKIPKGTPIVEVYSADFDEEKLHQLEEIDRKLKNQDTNIPFYSDIQKLDNIIEKEEQNYQNAIQQGSPNADKIQKRIEDLKAKKEEILSKGPIILQKIESLKEQKEYLKKYVEKNMITVNSPESGIVSYYFDGNESILNERNMFNLNPTQLENLNFQSKKISTEVKGDYPFVKIVDNLEWYLALVLNEKQQNLLKEDSNVKILLDNYGGELRGKVIKTYKGDDKLYIGIIEMIDEYPDFYKTSKINVKVKVKEYHGLKIPLSSIVQKEGKKGVFVIKNGKVPTFKEVVIKATDGKYAIVESVDKTSGLKVYDEIAVNGEDYLSK
ncbi:HlyD family efflux transporter periplasmic adaptor subunit [Thermoanaerobacter uzonensis]|uniref:HlyD family efflux transporter periplasmic adaptor subunit n=1 Tax=Thermoanaerobacter uzonensis TaxID=447593 RepID=UPI003D769CC5